LGGNEKSTNLGDGAWGETIMLALCTSPSEISLVLGSSDARWLSEEMSFLAELYRSKAGSSERQFGADHNVAAASFWETSLKCQRLSVALGQAVRRGYSRENDGPPSDQPVGPSPATDRPHPVWLLPVLWSPSARPNARPCQSACGENRVRRKRKKAQVPAVNGGPTLSVPPPVDSQPSWLGPQRQRNFAICRPSVQPSV
jgi:hypothetical protein